MRAAIIAGCHQRVEQRRVTVTAEYGSGDAVRSEYIYEVINLAGVS